MKLNIDTPTPEMGVEESDKLNRDNVAALRKTINATGVFILADVRKNTLTTLAIAAAKTLIQGMEAVVTTGGGVVEINFYTTHEVGAGVSLAFYLYIDGKQNLAMVGAANGGAAAIAVNSTMNYKASLGEGRHTVQVYYTTNGAFPISYNSLDTRLVITETKL